jgi:hypothetical protein
VKGCCVDRLSPPPDLLTWLQDALNVAHDNGFPSTT